MANQGKRRKNKSQMKNQKENHDAQQDPREDTASFEFDEETVHDAEGYHLNEDWENWEPEEEELIDPPEEDDYEDDYPDYDPEEDHQNAPPKRNDVNLCDHCGEEYSVTYRRCPFCDERSPSRKGGGNSYGNGMDPRHFVGFAISMVLIFTAGFIVVQEVLPLLRPNSSSNSTDKGTSSAVTDPVVDDFDNSVPTPDQVTGDVTGEVTGDGLDLNDDTLPEVPATGDETVTPPAEPETPTVEPETPTLSSTVVLSSEDVSLKGDESFTLRVTSGGTASWSSSHPEIASVDSNGVVTNLNSSGSTKTVEIFGTVNGGAAVCIVRCASGTGSGASSTPATDSGTSSESSSSSNSNVSLGAAEIANASNGVRIRSGPGTGDEYSVLATGANGSAITVVKDAGNNWYEIQFIGASGKQTGYIMGDYIKMN